MQPIINLKRNSENKVHMFPLKILNNIINTCMYVHMQIILSTGIDEVNLSLDEVNFCLEWDEKSPVWGIGIVRNDLSRWSHSNINVPNLSKFAQRFGNRVNIIK